MKDAQYQSLYEGDLNSIERNLEQFIVQKEKAMFDKINQKQK